MSRYDGAVPEDVPIKFKSREIDMRVREIQYVDASETITSQMKDLLGPVYADDEELEDVLNQKQMHWASSLEKTRRS